MTAARVGEIQERPEMHEKPQLFDDLGLVALPTAIGCARMFARCTLGTWGASSFVIADAVVIAGELVANSVQDTGVLDNDVRWSELDHLNRIVVCLLGFARHIVVEVWDVASEPAVLPADQPDRFPTGLHLVDVTAYRWGSRADAHGRLTWAELMVYDRTESGLPIRTRRPGHPPKPAITPVADDELLRRVRDGLGGL